MQTEDFGLLVREIAEKQGISQVELAERSSVSRVQINRIFSGGTAVRPETRQRIAAALGLDESSISRLGAMQRYRRKMHEKYLVKSLAGLGFAELQRQPLNTFYVPPAGVLGSFEKRQDEVRASGEPAPAVELIRANKRAVVLGVPGSGKTTLLQFLATEVASGELGRTEIPLVVRLPEFALALQEQPELSIFDWVVSQAESMECPDIVEPLLDQLQNTPGSTLALFDGLDEVPGSDVSGALGIPLSSARGRVIDAIRDFVSCFPSQRFVVTSRINGFDETRWNDLGFQKIVLQEYGEEQIRSAVTKWSTILSNSKHEPASKIAKDLIDAIFENPRVKQLAGNPLILTILILMCKARGYALPRRRVDLYEKVTEVFLDSWEASKRKEHGFRETGNIDLDTRELKWLIAELALAMQKAGLVTAHRWWVIDHVRDMLCTRLGFDAFTANKQADPVLRFVSARAGLLDERMPGVFAFTHRTMQEYFAAVGLIEDANIDPVRAGLTQMVRPYAYHPEWSEVVRLVTAQVSPSPAEELLKVIVDDPDPTGRFLRRGPLLALRCLADGATVSDRKFVQSIFESLGDLGASPWLGVAIDAFRALRLLTGTRYEQVAADTRKRILGTARERLSKGEFETLYLAANGPETVELKPSVSEAGSPVLRRLLRAGEYEVEHYFPNFALFSKDQGVWQELAGDWLDRDDVADKAKEAIVWFMRYAFDGDPEHQKRIRIRLRRTLASRQSSSVRAVAAKALGDIPRGGVDVSATLSKRLLDRGEPEVVRSACASSLRHSARRNAQVRENLLHILQSEDEPESVREGAAYGLEESTEAADVAATLHLFAAADPPDRLSVACVRSLHSVCDRYFGSYLSWLNEATVRAIPAALVLAEAYVTGRLNWSDEIVRRIEDRLQSAGTGAPGSDAPSGQILAAITSLVDARERRGGLRREAVIGDALRPHAEKIRFAFVFGSVAKNDQEQNSDIDLMLIGNITQKEIAGAVKEMQSLLGRQVNPAIYSVQKFAQKYRDVDPFIVDVVRGQKSFINVDDQLAAEKEFFDELGALEKQ